MAGEIIFEGKEATTLEVALFTALSRGPLSGTALAERVQLDRRRACELFDALVAGGLLERHGEQYANVEEIDRLLTGTRTMADRVRPLLPQVLSLVLAVTLGLSAVQASGGFAHRAPAAEPRAMYATSAGGDATSALALPMKPLSQGKSDGPLFYFVDSDEQAETVLLASANAGDQLPWNKAVAAGSTDEIIEAWSAPVFSWIFVVVSSEEEEQQTRDLVALANNRRALNGLPAVKIGDMRPLFDPAGPP